MDCRQLDGANLEGPLCGPVGPATAFIYDLFMVDADAVWYHPDKSLVYTSQGKVEVPPNYRGYRYLILFYVKERLKNQANDALHEAWPEPWVVLDKILAKFRNHAFAQERESELFVERFRATIAPGVKIPSVSTAFPRKVCAKKRPSSGKEVTASFLKTATVTPTHAQIDLWTFPEKIRGVRNDHGESNVTISCAELSGQGSSVVRHLCQALRGVWVTHMVNSYTASTSRGDSRIGDERTFWEVLDNLVTGCHAVPGEWAECRELASFLGTHRQLFSPIERKRRYFRARAYRIIKKFLAGCEDIYVAETLTCKINGEFNMGLRYGGSTTAFLVDLEMAKDAQDVLMYVSGVYPGLKPT